MLHNLVPEGSTQFALPKLRVHVESQFNDGDLATDAVLQTVLLETDARRLTMVWHAAQRCHGREHKLRQSVVRWQGEQAWVEAPST